MLKLTVGGTGTNVAVTAVLLFRVIEQGLVPEQPPPDQPVKPDPASAVAVSTTGLPPVRVTEQVPPQLIAGEELDVTVPAPVPDLVTDSWAVAGMALNVAMSVVLDHMGTVQDPLPLQSPPDQPANVDPDWAVAVKVMAVPQATEAGHAAPLQATLPPPLPAVWIVSVGVILEAVKVVWTVNGAVTTTVQVLVGFGQAPPQVPRVFPAEGEAVSSTEVPTGTVMLQEVLVLVQAIPAGDEVIVPGPFTRMLRAAMVACVSVFGESVPPPVLQPRTVERTIARDIAIVWNVGKLDRVDIMLLVLG